MPELLNKVCQHIAVAHQVQAVTLVIELPAGLRLIEQVERALRLYIQLCSQHDDYPARFSPKDFFTHKISFYFHAFHKMQIRVNHLLVKYTNLMIGFGKT